MESQVEIPCMVCGGDAFEVICNRQEIAVQREFLTHFHHQRLRSEAPQSALEDRATFTQDYATDIVACRDCGLVMRNPRPTNAEIERTYQQDEYGTERLAAIFQAQCDLYKPKAALLQQRLPPGAHVLEVGSFVGGFLAAGRELGWKVQGIDPGQEVAGFCREKKLPVFEGILSDFPADAHSIDAVAIWNTFDQMPDPKPVLDAARCLLKPGGLLALRVPNGLCFRNHMEHWRQARHSALQPVADALLCSLIWNNLLSFPYLCGYTVATLDRLLAEFHFERVYTQGDTLVTLSDEHTKPWAFWEEKLVKSGAQLAIGAEALAGDERFVHSPWLDSVYRATDASRSSSETVTSR